MIELERVTKSFGPIIAVDGISFKARPGEILGLIGPNGAGKSTTIRMIMNIIAPDSGNIFFSGKPFTEKDKDRIGYLPEERGLYKKMRVNDLLLYFSFLKGKNRKDAQKSIDYWLGEFSLSRWKNQKIEELSKGMSQKIQFITAITHDPELLFFDEPFSGIDPVSSDLIMNIISGLARKGKTILFSTHLMENAEKICNSIFLINKGKEVVSGPLVEVKNQFGKKSVILEIDGNTDFLDTRPEIARIIRYPRWLEIELSEDASSDSLLAACVGKIHIRRFEIVSPSLHKIFISLSEGQNYA